MASDQRVSLAHPSISISIFNQRFATFSVAAFQPIVSAPHPQGVFQTFFKLSCRAQQAAVTVSIHSRNAIVPTAPQHSNLLSVPLWNQQQLRHTTADAHANGPRNGKEPLKALFFAPILKTSSKSRTAYQPVINHIQNRLPNAPSRNRTENLLIKSQLL